MYNIEKSFHKYFVRPSYIFFVSFILSNVIYNSINTKTKCIMETSRFFSFYYWNVFITTNVIINSLIK